MPKLARSQLSSGGQSMTFLDEKWDEISPLLLNYNPSPKGGRPRLNRRKILKGILFVSKNKIPWKAIPKEYGSGTALNDYFRQWAKAGVFHRLNDRFPIQFSCLDWNKINSLHSNNLTIGHHYE